jgi:hypothetical protein
MKLRKVSLTVKLLLVQLLCAVFFLEHKKKSVNVILETNRNLEYERKFLKQEPRENENESI